MRNLLADLRFAARSYRRTPLLAVAIVLTLALGIGAVGAIFSVVDAVILQPLPYEEPDELVLVASQFPTMGFDRFWISPPEYMELEEWNRSFEAVAGYRSGDVSVVGTDEPMRARALFATASLQPVLGVPPLLGRWYDEGEDTPDGAQVLVLSEPLWRSTFAADRDVIGRRLEINGETAEVIGVMPAGFDIEESGAAVFLPAGLDRSNRENRGSHWLNVVARLRDGVSFEAAATEVESLVAGWEQRSGAGHNPNPETHPYRVLSLHEEVVGDTRPALLSLLGAVAFVLLIACVNVANLLLSRSESRQREIAVRSIMGASRGRVVAQMLTESMALAVVSGALGLLLAHWGLRAILAVNPDALPRSGDIGLDWSVALFAAGVSLLTGLLFGLAPALRMGTRRFVDSLGEGGQRTSQSVAARRVRQGLVALELALAVALVVGAGLMIKSLGTLLAVDPGFDAGGLTSFEVYMPESRYAEGGERAAFVERLTTSLRAIPSVDGVAATSDLPPQRQLNANDTEFEGLERTEDGPPHNTDYWEFITAETVDTMGLRILAGRAFDSTDHGQSTPVVMVNQRLAETFWPDQNAVGKRLRPGWGDQPWFTVVGIVDDVKQDGLDKASGTHVYWLYDQAATISGAAPRGMYMVVSSDEPAATLHPRLRQAVWSLDPTMAVSGMRPMEEVVVASASRSQLLALLLGMFATVALFLAAVGIYGVLSYSVAQRGHEIGIRMALGADRPRVLSQILGQGMAVSAVGLVLGVGLALSISRWIRSLLFGVEATDTATYAWVIVILATVSLVACLIPALRATRIDPLNALRHD